jgi:hypothetical protein
VRVLLLPNENSVPNIPPLITAFSGLIRSTRSRWADENGIIEIAFKRELRRNTSKNSPFFEIARVLMRFNHVASFIVNANHGVV